MFKIELWQTVTDRVSGFRGVVTGRCDYMTGCNRYQVTPKVGADGKWQDSVWFDEHVLDVDNSVDKMAIEQPAADKQGAYGSDPR
jgi:hypothetical protein